MNRGLAYLLGAFIGAISVAVVVYAAQVPPPSSSSFRQQCTEATLCNSQSATGACVVGADQIHMKDGKYTHTFYATQSTATSFECDVYSNDTGYSATAKQQLNSDPMTESNMVLSLEGLFNWIWVECPVLADNQVTITSMSCPIN